MANRPLGLGVVGAGSIGIRAALQHFACTDIHDRAILASVCDPAPGRAEAAAQKFGVGTHYDTYEGLLEDKTVDLISICSPISLHYEQGLMAIEAGKHIHFNKTMTVTTAEAQDLIAKGEKAGIKIVASPGQMAKPHLREARRIIMEGELGKLAWAVTGAAFGTYHEREGLRQGDDPLSNINPTWYWKKPGGGPLYDMTVYGLHSLTGILGPAKRVTAMSANAIKEREFRGQMYPCDAEDNTLMVLDFGDGVFAFAFGTFIGGWPGGWGPHFFGTKGQIHDNIHNDQPIPIGEGLNSIGSHVSGVHATMEENHVYEDMMQLVAWILDDNAKPYATAEHATHVIEIIEAALRASETGQTQELTTTFETVS